MKLRLPFTAFLLAILLWLPYSRFAVVGWAAIASSPEAALSGDEANSAGSSTVHIPGPLYSFLRMAAISQVASLEEVLTFVARNAVVEGYEYRDEKAHKPTEYMVLLQGYLKQARELEALAGEQGLIRVSNCAEAQPLLRILGYRFREKCGPETILETADPDRAFLTIDSAFPLVELEQALRKSEPFVLRYASSEVPVLFEAGDWSVNGKDVVDSLLANPPLARLYWALSHLDGETRSFLRRSPGLEKLVPLASVLDFYGSHLHIRSGRVVVPGGAKAEAAWESLVGVSPNSPAEFVLRLLEKDEGWLAVYFDALGWPPPTLQAYFTEPERLKRFYGAWQSKDVSTSPARPVFRPTPDLLLLTTRLHLNSNGQPLVPGNLEIWKEIFRRSSNTKTMREWAKRAAGWNKPEQLIEALFALSRIPSQDGPLQIYLMLTEIERRRAPEHRLKPPTVRLLAEKYSRYQDQYLTFSEWSVLDDEAISQFVHNAEIIDRIPDRLVRANARGMFQAQVGLWQILAR
ncbi:MAG: hypothetical protein HY647_10345, partial [Acidobacteria bacterium]|nr:hypothetical protein [Acidobacteriota bacterium]